MCVYLIHFEKPIGSSHPRGKAQHYLGFATNGKLNQRLERHAIGDGAKLMRAVVLSGISWKVANVWLNETREFERKLKRSKNIKRICLICCGKKLFDD